MRAGLIEIIIVGLVALALLKPENMKEYIKSFYRTLNVAKEAKKEFDAEITQPINDIKDDVVSSVKGED